MTVKELKEVLGRMKDDSEVYIYVNEPAGFICPDGAVVEVKNVFCGFDWHMGKVLIVPKYRLNIQDVDEWSGKTKKENKNENNS